jgi:hypothetical protein
VHEARLRHSALQHLAEAGRSVPELQAKSCRQHLASLGRYIRLGEETSARITAEHDPANRRRRPADRCTIPPQASAPTL